MRSRWRRAGLVALAAVAERDKADPLMPVRMHPRDEREFGARPPETFMMSTRQENRA